MLSFILVFGQIYLFIFLICILFYFLRGQRYFVSMINWCVFSSLIFSINEFLAKAQDYPYVMADSLLDVLTQGGHSRSLRELEMVRLL